ncbi:MAG: PstS family phosphate ABC transporter substrate-binding protein [Flavobacteriales bacterium]|nr:PstS family phosphate ABC transporter substrate-binding protein [Flavobacteriales bacterium]
MKTIIKIILGVSVIFTLASCRRNTEKSAENTLKDKELRGSIKIDGSSTVYPITEAIAEEFRAVAPEVKVTVGVSGTGGGFKKFSRGETAISDASRPIKDKEKIACEENGISYVQLEVAYDGLAVLVNPANDWLDHLSVEELKKIWEPAAQGVIMRWSQIRDGFPDEEIHLFGPGVASGTYDYFTKAICGEEGASRGDYTASEDDNVLVQGISTDKYGLGFFGLAYFEENKDKLKLVGVDGGEGVVIPTQATVADGTYQPLSRPIFIYVKDKAAEREEVVTFVTFYLELVPEIAQEVGYIALPAAEYAKQAEKFQAFISKK